MLLAVDLTSHIIIAFVPEPSISRHRITLLLKVKSDCLPMHTFSKQPDLRTERLMVGRKMVPLVILVQAPKERLAHEAIIQIQTRTTVETRAIDVLLSREMLTERSC